MFLIRKGVVAIVVGGLMFFLVGPVLVVIGIPAGFAISGVGIIVCFLGVITLAVAENQRR